ncbi:MAG: hypothetical protein JOZ33_04610, partial [Acidobacteriaceae bacterium]|nr:hypothetical protein [Acidobacteriaceae bacterium]
MVHKDLKTRRGEHSERGTRPVNNTNRTSVEPANPKGASARDDGEIAAAVVSRRAADRLRSGHVWVYRSDVLSVPDDAGQRLAVTDQREILLGTALYSSVSEITLRLISTELIATEAEWLELVGTRVRKA